MKNIKILGICLFLCISAAVRAQEIPQDIMNAISLDDSAKMGTLVNKDNINQCYGYYSFLSITVKSNAINCFKLLLAKGANVNTACNGYVPPLMHAAKYGRFDMAKLLVAAGADVNYKYDSNLKVNNGPVIGDTPFTYAEKWHHQDIADYLKPLISP